MGEDRYTDVSEQNQGGKKICRNVTYHELSSKSMKKQDPGAEKNETLFPWLRLHLWMGTNNDRKGLRFCAKKTLSHREIIHLVIFHSKVLLGIWLGIQVGGYDRCIGI